jgi:molybdopterin synthase catalytic subunit
MMTDPRCRIVTGPIDVSALFGDAASPSDGAVLVFVGVVRESNEGRDVEHLDYEAYAPMAESVLSEIVAEAEERWETGRISVVHRVGQLAIGDPSVVITVAAPHRGAAYDASRYVIEELKKRVPIWKREGYVTGESEWVTGTVPAAAEVTG